jgi:hypothetical protein
MIFKNQKIAGRICGQNDYSSCYETIATIIVFIWYVSEYDSSSIEDRLTSLINR